jgi:DNA-binding response OmpR family regulator
MDGVLKNSPYKKAALYVDNGSRKQICVYSCVKSLGFELHKAATIPAAMEMIKEHFYQLILIDCDAADKDVFGFCSTVRAGDSNAVLIALMADAEINIEAKLFDSGVNDVITGEQICPRILTRRVRAHLRSNSPFRPRNNVVILKDVVVDFERREVRRNGKSYQLRGLLFDLLKYFLDNPNRIISREELLRSPIWADSICSAPEDGGKTFDVNMSKLRKIIEPDPAKPQIITSLRGVGWKLTTERLLYRSEKLELAGNSNICR